MTREQINGEDIIGTLSLGGQEITLRKTLNPDDPTALSVIAEESNARLLESIASEIRRTNWWLYEYWEAKGLPKQQIELSNGELQVTVYNYSEDLKTEEVDLFQKVLGSLSGLGEGVIFDYYRYLLIDDNQPIYDKTGRPQNGVTRSDLKTVTLFPNAFQLTSSALTDEVSHLGWVLAHEGSHSLEQLVSSDGKRLVDKWKKVGKWSYVDRRVLPGGAVSLFRTEEPGRCISELAQADDEEDLAESGAAYMFIPGRLDTEKRLFLEAEVPIDRQKKRQPWFTRNVSPADIMLPKLPEEFEIKTYPRRAFVSKDPARKI